MGDVSSNPRSVDDIEQGQVLDLPRELQQEGHGLSDPPRGTHHGHLAQQERKCNEGDGQQKVIRKCGAAADSR